MKLVMVITLSVALMFIFNGKCSFVKDRRQQICVDQCVRRGAAYGVMISSYECQCYGTSNDGAIKKP